MAKPTIVGHYWRPWEGLTERRVRFPNRRPTGWAPSATRFASTTVWAFATDCAGKAEDNTRLAALRWDEGPPRLVSDRGETIDCTRSPR